MALLLLSFNCAFAIDENTQTKAIKKQGFFSKIFHKNNKKNDKNKSAKTSKINKNKRVEDIKLPLVVEKRRHSLHQLNTMTLDDCVNYALLHNPNLKVSEERYKAAKASIGESRSNYAPRLTGRVNYNHNTNHGTRLINSQENSAGFNVGISEMIWDFGRTTAKINMAKYDTLSSQFDWDYEVLGVIYDVKINYYKVLSALANLDIYEQNVRIQKLNYERTKAMFDEGLKSKIDVVNAEVNLTDSKILLVEGRNNLETALINLKNSMYFEEDIDFLVQNTENFNFLKTTDYKKKFESITTIKPPENDFKKTEDGLILLTSGIEHKDIIQDYVFVPMTLSKQEAVKQALELRPDLKANEMLAKVQQESLKAIKKQYLPEITGDLTWGYSKNEHSYSSPLQIGASVGVGSINPALIHYQVKQGESYLDIAYHNVNIARADIFWEVQNNYINMRQLERKIPLINSKVKATLENFELADGRYSVGLNNYVELQDALTNYNNTQLNFVEAVFNYNVARETLLKSMGVRWKLKKDI